MRHVAFLILLCITPTTWANEVPHTYILEAEAHYEKGDYNSAVQYLLAIPGMARFAPKITAQNKDTRARVLFDLGCSYLAAGDSLQADYAFKSAFVLNDELKKGYFDQPDSGTFWWALLRNKEANRRLKTSRLGAAMRSLTFPGWGQFYRGNAKKGYAFLGSAIAISGFMGMQYFKYKNAQNHYEAIDPRHGGNVNLVTQFIENQRYTNEDGTNYTEWVARHRKLKSSEKRLNVMFGVLGVLWTLGIADSAIFGPAPMSVSIPF